MEGALSAQIGEVPAGTYQYVWRVRVFALASTVVINTLCAVECGNLADLRGQHVVPERRSRGEPAPSVGGKRDKLFLRAVAAQVPRQQKPDLRAVLRVAGDVELQLRAEMRCCGWCE